MATRTPPPPRVGCSGWEYKHWRGDFYPAELPRASWLDHYAARFDTVEINNSFYRLPDKATVRGWRSHAPPGFLFAWKGSRFLTHMKKLKDAREPLVRLFDSARELGPHLGPVLYQLPPRWKRNATRLREFLLHVPRDVPQAVEFRDPSWYHDEVLTALEEHGVALCLHDLPGSASPREAVGRFVYVRFHGSGARYGGGYPRAALEEWAAWLSGRHRAGRPVYAYFNNDVGGHAPRDAVTLRGALATDLAGRSRRAPARQGEHIR
jgi:uncharacterized protein YecE (DUF72 family)